MPFAIRQLIHRGYWAPADDGADLGGSTTPTTDRGDDITSPLDTAGKDDAQQGGDKDPEDAANKEGEETADERAERERAEAEAEKTKRIRVPKARLDEVIGKARQREQALLEEITKLKGGQQAADTTRAVKDMRDEIDKLQDKYEDMILDGRKDEARKIRRQVEGMRDELAEYQTNVKSDAARSAAIEEMSYNAQLAGMEAKYPALNPEHPDFDAGTTDEVAALLDAFVKAGQKRNEALARAIRYVLGAPPTRSDADTKAAGDKRAADARKRAADADRRQPADSRNVGLDSDKAGSRGAGDIDVMRLDQKKFAKLDEDMLARLRGDTL